MALKVVDGGEAIAIQLLVNKIATPEDVVLRLYTNDITPGETDVVGTYTEATGYGYAAKTLTGASWTVTGTAPTKIGYAKQTWTFTGALGNVYGYYYTRVTTGDLVAAERFTDGPYNITADGDFIDITPEITAD